MIKLLIALIIIIAIIILIRVAASIVVIIYAAIKNREISKTIRDMDKPESYWRKKYGGPDKKPENKDCE